MSVESANLYVPSLCPVFLKVGGLSLKNVNLHSPRTSMKIVNLHSPRTSLKIVNLRSPQASETVGLSMDMMST